MQTTTLWIIILILVITILFLARANLAPKRRKGQKLPRKDFTTPASADNTSHIEHVKTLPSSDSIHLQLEILRQALSATTVILLWAGEAEENIQTLAVASQRDDVIITPFHRGSGIIGGIGPQCKEISVAPVPQHLATISYYPSNRDVGSFLAYAIPLTRAILCVDRLDSSPWRDNEKELAQLTVQKLSQDLRTEKKMEETSRDKQAIQKICLGMQELNQALGLQSVFTATIKMVSKFLEADFIAINLLQGKEHCIVKAVGPKADEIEGLCFPAEEGLVGQAIKLRRWMPPHSNYQGAAPIFSTQLWSLDFQSLLILPLLKEDNEAIGALTVACKNQNLISPELRSILQVIAAQVATKIELGRAHEKIYQLATTDGLTGLSNHRTFQLAFDNMLHRAQRQSTSLAMVLCDLDHFKSVNDTYGHPFGDIVLKKVASVLQNTIRAVDLAARYGGEEFALLLENSNSEGAGIQVERVRKAIADLSFQHEVRKVTISMSFGLASFPADADNKNDLIEQADQALYEAKKQGRNRTVVWSPLLKG
ncbi:MAG: sensor domain-containing diguanylate cyclase [Desulfobulbaceae bacterium]|nr:sensor domain-containing diguanylate cyclase [Desulfobulbaceae bacterium]